MPYNQNDFTVPANYYRDKVLPALPARRSRSADDITALRVYSPRTAPLMRNYSEADALKRHCRKRPAQHQREIFTTRSLFDTIPLPDIDPKAGWRERWARHLLFVQHYFIFMQIGIVVAMVWANIDWDSYDSVWGAGEGHELNIHFFVNDVFMALFFGVAMVHVTSAVIPGGALFPFKKALSPLLGTVGGVLGPAIIYLGLVAMEGRFELEYQGWAACIATDISVAWLFAVQVFGTGDHPAVQFLLLLAVMDDVFGLVVIAIFFPSGDMHLEWLAMVAGAIAIAATMRWYMHISHWWLYILIAGPLSWYGLFRSGVHPALALCFVVPFIPGKANLEKMDKSCSLGVHIGLFFFGLANAGVVLTDWGMITMNVAVALVLGKTAGIFLMAWLGSRVFGLPLPTGMSSVDLGLLAHISGVGLTVSLFVAELAFQDQHLRGAARLGALISVLVGPSALIIQNIRKRAKKSDIVVSLV
jgi:Na+:H+ antiporter, NhaA family